MAEPIPAIRPVTPELLARIARIANPDPPDTPACACSPIRDDPALNCYLHGWWTCDPAVLDLAQLTADLDDPRDAAMTLFGGTR
jgi:hypothetical protein